MHFAILSWSSYYLFTESRIGYVVRRPTFTCNSMEIFVVGQHSCGATNLAMCSDQVQRNASDDEHIVCGDKTSNLARPLTRGGSTTVLTSSLVTYRLSWWSVYTHFVVAPQVLHGRSACNSSSHNMHVNFVVAQHNRSYIPV